MKWLEINVRTTSEASDAIYNRLIESGSTGVSIVDSLDIKSEINKKSSLYYFDKDFIENLDEDVIIKAYFHEGAIPDRIISDLKELIDNSRAYLNFGNVKFSYLWVDERDWENEWKKYYTTFNLTENIVVRPSWENAIIENDKKEIILDPGMAFGSGTHETTKLCSLYIEKYLKPGDNLLDLGCGSGILSIVAYKLGAKKLTCVDIDEVAIKVTQENFVINGLDKKDYLLINGELGNLKNYKFDIITANIIADVIIDIADEVKKYLSKDGLLITSGIIRERQDEVISAYQEKGYNIIDINSMGEWVAIVFK